MPVPGPAKNEDLHEPSGWERRYRSGEIPWDLGLAPPALLDLLERLGPPCLRVLVPGAGYGHDALAWAGRGHRTTAVDIAPSAIAGLRMRAERAGLQMEALEADLFDLPDSLAGVFDAVWEQTCFCAILPAQRPAYVRAMASALRERGHFYGLFWNHGMPAGPPWSLPEAEIRAAFEPTFIIESVAPVEQSAGERRNEYLAIMRKRL